LREMAKSEVSHSSSSSESDGSGQATSSKRPAKRRRLHVPACVVRLFVDLETSSGAALADAVEVKVHVQEGLDVVVLEGSSQRQEQLVELAVRAPPGACETDPYGAALWPSGQVLAQAVAAYAKVMPKGASMLELGAGCGLATLVAAKLGMRALATDFRQLPLDLLSKAAHQQGLSSRVQTRVFDVANTSLALPPGDLVVASDLLYDRVTAAALADRTLEALRRGSIVLLGDPGRLGCEVLLQKLRHALPDQDVTFRGRGIARQQVDGGGEGDSREVAVEILELPTAGIARAAVKPESPCVATRPRHVGAVSLVESTCFTSAR